ncbi:hypothetical protein [Aureispira anguillae]|uniref:Uncharacterized protein n=1 Tax=Aureispira anguillae TaxID=2864201 RepID=A0A915YD52_9BACT|nr:hypothetical protein [Aureispira anguillae]BDS10882.1 hypothetical protein AsAng_0015920 [Aureispira anguillae]
MKPDIEIICPSCSSKAAFYAPTVVRRTCYVPDMKGKVACSFCGCNREHDFTSKDYYYSIPVGRRFLYARTMENLKVLLAYFKENKRRQSDPELDFPKEFYENRLEIVKRIENKIYKELEK